MSRSFRTILLSGAIALSFTSTRASAIELDRGNDSHGGPVAWIGCWQPTPSETNAESPTSVTRSICIEVGDEPDTLVLRARENDEVVAEDVLTVDGEKHRADTAGCSGWKRVALSGDSQRLYTRSERRCDAGPATSVSAASLMTSDRRWIDINVTTNDGRQDLSIQSYRLLSDQSNSPWVMGIPLLDDSAPETEYGPIVTPEEGSSEPGAVEAHREHLDVDDVIEALGIVDPAVVEAMLVESGSKFDTDAAMVIGLDDANVPDAIIDLIIGLSHPAYFRVEGGQISATGGPRYVSYGSPWFYGPGYHWPYGYYYYHYPDDHPDPPPSPPRQSGRAIQGVGYTRVERTSQSASGVAGFFRAGGGGGSSGGASAVSSGGSSSPSGYSGGSNSGRTAVPR
jgi:hypothetical protein